MICYKDKTFCESKTCKNDKCERKVTELLFKEAEDYGLPVAVGNFENNCKVYKK